MSNALGRFRGRILPLEQQRRCQPLFRIAPEEIAVLCTRSAGCSAINPFNNVPAQPFLARSLWFQQPLWLLLGASSLSFRHSAMYLAIFLRVLKYEYFAQISSGMLLQAPFSECLALFICGIWQDQASFCQCSHLFSVVMGMKVSSQLTEG